MRAEIERIQQGPDTPARWEREHPDAREQLQAAELAFEQAVDREAARAIEHPGQHLTRVLGERPAPQQTVEREAWDDAAWAVERYRIAHEVDSAEPTADPSPSIVARPGSSAAIGARSANASLKHAHS